MKSKKKFELFDHPWIAFWALLISIMISLILSAGIVYGLIRIPQNDPFSQFSQSLIGHLLMVFLIIPFILHLPKGKRKFKGYLHDIGIIKVNPFFRLIILAFSCYIILVFFQFAGVFIFRLSEGKEITGDFIRYAFDIRRELPPKSFSLIFSLPSIFEEIVFRGVLLTVFSLKYSKIKAIIYSSFGFSIMHLVMVQAKKEFC